MAVKAKICGIRRGSDAEHAVRAGADFLGVVLDAGPRQATPDELLAVVDAAGATPVMAVVVAMGVDEVLHLRDRTGFHGVQLHGGQESADARRYAEAGLIVWRTARLSADSDTRGIGKLTEHADAVLVEPSVAHVPGGAGIPLELGMAAGVRRELDPLPMVLAGGLTPETVARAATLVRPYAVDVSSGVERAPGVKDSDRVMRFLEAIRDINSGA